MLRVKALSLGGPGVFRVFPESQFFIWRNIFDQLISVRPLSQRIFDLTAALDPLRLRPTPTKSSQRKRKRSMRTALKMKTEDTEMKTEEETLRCR